MRPIERIVIIGGLILAITLALGGRGGSSTATAAPAADTLKIGTVDMYLVIEKLMQTEPWKSKRDDTMKLWQSRADAIDKSLKELEDQFKVLPQNSPQIPEIQQKAQQKQAEMQQLAQDRQQDLEKMNSAQLIEAYAKVRTAAVAVGERLGYSHVFSQRGYDKAIETVTVATTIQELLARPLVRGVPTDDITKAVMTELKLEP